MNKKSTFIISFLLLLSSMLIGEICYLQATIQNEIVLAKKKKFTKSVGLPDLALFTNEYSSRHRSLSNIFEIYADDGTLREYAFAPYTLSHSHIYKEQLK